MVAGFSVTDGAGFSAAVASASGRGVPAAPPVGLRAAEVTRAGFVLVGHAHFDHIAGAEIIARNTGATVIGSHESCRVNR